MLVLVMVMVALPVMCVLGGGSDCFIRFSKPVTVKLWSNSIHDDRDVLKRKKLH